METIYEVCISDTIHGSSERRSYKTLFAAQTRYEHLTRTLRRNGHNRVVLFARCGDQIAQVYPAPILDDRCHEKKLPRRLTR
jgi:hypothetical protein